MTEEITVQEDPHSKAVKIGVTPIRGEDIPVFVTCQGTFIAEYNKASYTATTLEKLREKLLTALRVAKVKVAIPATLVVTPSRWGGGAIVSHGVITGIHATTGKVLFRPNKGTPKQIDNWEATNSLFRLLNDEEVADLKRLREQYREAERVFGERQRILRLPASPAALVKQAIDAAVVEQRL